MPIAGEDRAKREHAVGTMRQVTHQQSNSNAGKIVGNGIETAARTGVEPGVWRSREIRLVEPGPRAGSTVVPRAASIAT
jgi:hypothetical protein